MVHYLCSVHSICSVQCLCSVCTEVIRAEIPYIRLIWAPYIWAQYIWARKIWARNSLNLFGRRKMWAYFFLKLDNILFSLWPLGSLGLVFSSSAIGKRMPCISTANVVTHHKHVLTAHSSTDFLFCPMYPGDGGVSGKLLRNASSADLKAVRDVCSLMLRGTTHHAVQCCSFGDETVEPQSVDAVVLRWSY